VCVLPMKNILLTSSGLWLLLANLAATPLFAQTGAAGGATPPSGYSAATKPPAGVRSNAAAVANARGGSTNQTGLAATSRPEVGSSNRIYAVATNAHGAGAWSSNTITATNGAALDSALTESDWALINRFRSNMIQRLAGTMPTWAPVTFNATNGIVTVGGSVPSPVTKQRLVATLQTFPGVVRVIDRVAIDPNMTANFAATRAATNTNANTSTNITAASASSRTVTSGNSTNALAPTARPGASVPRVFRDTPTNSTPLKSPQP